MKNGVPDKVAAQAEEADRQLEEAARLQKENADSPVATIVADDQNEPQDDQARGERAGTPVETLEVSAGIETPEEKVARLEKELATERQRYKTAQGMYLSQLPEMAATIRALRSELDQVKVAQQHPSVPPTPPEPAHLRHLKDSEKTDFADRDEALGIPGRAALGEAEAMVQRETQTLREQISRIENTLKQEHTNQRQATIWDAIDNLCPGAKVLDQSDPDWPRFLKERDPESTVGATHEETCLAALSLGRADIVASTIKRYKELAGLDNSAPTGSSGVRAQIKPGRARGDASTSGSPASKKLIKLSDIKKFYDDVTRQRYVGREDEQKKFEAEIDAAEAEGRIVNG